MGKPWRIIPRPLLETVLNNHVQRHRVPQPLILHGPRGVGKTTLILDRLMQNWNKPPHLTGYVDFGSAIPPWTSNSVNSPPGNLSVLCSDLESCLESMVEKAVLLGSIGNQQVFASLNKWHGLNGALRRILQKEKEKEISKASTSTLWNKAIFAISAKSKIQEIDSRLQLDSKEEMMTTEEVSYFREAMLSLQLAKKVIQIHQEWRVNAVRELNRIGGFSRSLANSSTDWPCLLLELLSSAAEIGFFQPKLVINNFDALRKAISTDDSIVSAALYHDSLLWRMVALCVNERCLPIILLTSDSYYSYRAFLDFGFPDIFISRETFGWTSQEAKLHMVSEYFTESEWVVIDDVLGPNPRHISELYVLKKSTYYQQVFEDGSLNTFEDIVDAYLAYLQVTVVNPAMESALIMLKKFVLDANNDRIPDDRLRFGAPWRHPPHTDNPTIMLRWAKIQLMDFIQSMINTDFGVNYLADCSLEILDDPAATAMMEVGLMYAQRDPSYIRPITKAVQRCLVRWLVHERMQMTMPETVQYIWQRIFRGRSYRHLMKEIGYK